MKSAMQGVAVNPQHLDCESGVRRDSGIALFLGGKRCGLHH